MGSDSPEALKEGVVAQLSLSRKGGASLTCISLSGDQRHGVVGGRELMKARKQGFDQAVISFENVRVGQNSIVDSIAALLSAVIRLFESSV